MNNVLITGCSSGYGLETARHFLAQGWNVVATMRTPRADVLPRSERLRVVALDVTRPESIAAALGISRSYLFMVMNAADTTLGRFVLEQRLQRASQMLGDPGVQCRTISEIAFSLGFQDLSHFSRRFTARFGRSPRAYRAGAQAVLSVA